MAKRRRPNRAALTLGWLFQRWAWWLTNCHDSWAIEWRDDEDHRCGDIMHGHYRWVLRAVRERRKGKILGCRAVSVPADGDSFSACD